VSTSCEWADVVFAVDSWPSSSTRHDGVGHQLVPEHLSAHPATRIFETIGDIEVLALMGKKMAAETGDKRFADAWKFVDEGRVDVYLQRVLNASTATKGYTATDLEAKAKEGVPALMMNRTYPKSVGYEQIEDSRPWYTKTGRLEFYREEDEFVAAGENLPVHREPIDSTFYEPNVIVAPSTRRSGTTARALRPGPERPVL